MFTNRKPCKKNGAMSVTVHFFLLIKRSIKRIIIDVSAEYPRTDGLPNPSKGGSNAGFSKIMALPAWWTATPEDRIAAREDPGKMDEDSGGILKKFKLSSDPEIGHEHSNADFPGSITASSLGIIVMFSQNKIAQMDFLNKPKVFCFHEMGRIL